MKCVVNGSPALCTGAIVVVMGMLAVGPSGAQSARKPAQCISFKAPIGGGQKKTNPFFAQEQTVDGRKWGVVTANGKGVMGIPTEAGGFTPFKRAQLVSERMNNLYQGGAKFKLADGYVVGKLNGEIVLAIKPATDSQKLELLFTIDGNLERMLTAHTKGKKATRADIAFYWRDTLMKALQDQPDIAMSPGEKDAWAKIPAGYGGDKSLTPLSDAQISSSKSNGGR